MCIHLPEIKQVKFLVIVMEIFGSSRYMSNSDLELSVAVDSKKDWISLGTIEANELLVSFEDDADWVLFWLVSPIFCRCIDSYFWYKLSSSSSISLITFRNLKEL
jgi:hypothetical protein